MGNEKTAHHEKGKKERDLLEFSGSEKSLRISFAKRGQYEHVWDTSCFFQSPRKKNSQAWDKWQSGEATIKEKSRLEELLVLFPQFGLMFKICLQICPRERLKKEKLTKIFFECFKASKVVFSFTLN